MKAGNPIQTKSYAFELRIVKLHRFLCGKFCAAARPLGANVEEAIVGQSRKDFLSKMSIAYKEARGAFNRPVLAERIKGAQLSLATIETGSANNWVWPL